MSDESTQRSFQPCIEPDTGNWSRASLPPPPRTSPEVSHNSSQQQLPAYSDQPLYTEQALDITRIGTTKEGDTCQRLQSIVSTLSNHHLPANPSSEALDHFRADRIGSVDDQVLLKGSKRPSMLTIGESQGRKQSGTSTLGTLNDSSVTSFTIERAQRASLSVRKMANGGSEEVMPYTAGVKHENTSPTDLDMRFAKPISLMARPPSRIDFTQPEGTPRKQGDHLVASHNPLITRSPNLTPQRDHQMPSFQDASLPLNHAESPSLPRPLDRERLPMIDVSPLISPKTVNAPVFTTGHAPDGTTITTGPSRSASIKKKRRPDSIILAHLRSPELGGQHNTEHSQSKDSPRISDALDGLTAGIATSVLAMKSAGGSTNFPYSLPPSATSASKTDMPKTPRAATSENCHSAVSDVESAELFQAWKGFAPPSQVVEPVPAIKRGLSVQATTAKPRPKAPRRAGTKDGDIDMEIVLNGETSVPTSTQVDKRLSVSKPVVILTPNTAREPDFGTDKSSHVKRASLTPSFASGSSSISSKSKITYLTDVVKEEKRLSMLSVKSG